MTPHSDDPAADTAAPEPIVLRAAALDDYLGGFGAAAGPPESAADTACDADDARAGLLDTILLLRQAAAEDGAGPSLSGAAAPRSIGRHAILRLAGEGGFATVWQGFDTILRRPVAVKVRRPELLLSADARRRFVREAEIAARLVHPHVVTIYEVGEEAGREFIAAEFCSGGSLAGWLERQPGPRPAREAARLVRALAGAVAAAHAAGVVHRDIKPANVMLVPAPAGMEPLLPASPGSDGGIGMTVKLGDFGLGKLDAVDDGADPLTQLTRTGASLGTPAWMAPEQVDRTFGPVGPATDVHALGLLLHRLLTGRAARSGGTTAETYRQVLVDDVPAADTVLRGVPRDLAAVCGKCLAKRPAERYPSAAALADDLDRWLEGRPTVARPLSPAGRAAGLIRRRPVVAALAAATVTASLVAGWAAAARVRAVREAGARESEIRRQRAAAELQRGFEALRAGNVAGALEHLEATRDSDPALAASLAGRWLLRRTHGERAILMKPNDAATAAGRPRDLYSITIAADGTTAAVAAADGTVRLIQGLDGTPLIDAVAAHDEVNAVAFSADGKRLVTAGEDGRVKWWDVAATGLVPAGEVNPTAGPLYAAAFAPDGRAIAVGGADRRVRLVRLDEPDRTVEIFRFDEPAGRSPDVESLVFTGSGTIAVSCGDRIALVDAATGRLVRELDLPIAGNRQTVLGSLSVSPDGGRLLACGTDTKAHVWDLVTGRITVSLPAHPAWVQGCCFVAGGDRVATACRDGGIRLFDAATGAALARLVGHVGRVWSVAAEPAGTLLSCGADGTVRRWDPGDDLETAALRMLPLDGGEIIRVAEAPGRAGDPAARAVVTLDTRTALHRIDLARGTSRLLPQAPGGGFNIDVAPTGRRVIMSLLGVPHLLALDLATDEAAPEPTAPRGSPATWTPVELPAAVDASRAAPCWLTDGSLLVSGWGGGVCRLSPDLSHATMIDAPLVAPVHDLVPAPSGPPRAAAIGKVTAILSLSAAAARVAARPLVLPVGEETTAVAWSPDGRSIACGTNSGRVVIFDAATGAQHGQLAPRERLIVGVAWAADGRILVTADPDSVRICDAATLSTLDEFRPGWKLRQLQLVADGARIVLAGRTGVDSGTGEARLGVVELDRP